MATSNPTANPAADEVPGSETEATCCGRPDKAWSKAGDPLKLACQLCPESSTYWRKRRELH
jgi:hypothetical protein